MKMADQLDRLEEMHPPIPIDSVDFTIERPDVLSGPEFAAAFGYFGRVETEVIRNVMELEVLLPNADDNTRRFYQIWEDQEVPHGVIFDTLQGHLGLEPETPDLNTISRSLQIAGRLSHLPGMHDVLLHTYLSSGAMHERLTALGYELLKQRLQDLGETALVETAIVPIKIQESGHFAYYVAASRDVRDRLAPWQLYLSRLIKTKAYAPVGAGNDEQKADFGGIAITLLDGQEIDRFADPVQRVAQELLVAKDSGLILPKFVLKGLQESIELHRDREASNEHN